MQQNKNDLQTTNKTKDSDRIPAIRMFNLEDESSAFEIGSIPILTPTDATSFWASNKTEDWEQKMHPAPRKQYVVTIKGKLKFTVSEGSTFILEPGIILLAEDTIGAGHSWEIIDGNEWIRLYIPLSADADDHFIAENIG